MIKVIVTSAGSTYHVEIEGADGLAAAERIAHSTSDVENAIVEMGYRKVTGWDIDQDNRHVTTVAQIGAP